MTEDRNQTSEYRAELLEAWKTSEEVAMHFNNLLLGFRLKAIGGVVAGALGAIGLKLGELAEPQIVFAVFLALAVTWALVWAADFFYYYRLLTGAVDELLRLEAALGNVRLSNLIERRVRGGGPPADLEHQAGYPSKYPSWPLWVFYFVPGIILIWMATVLWFALPISTQGSAAQTTVEPVAVTQFTLAFAQNLDNSLREAELCRRSLADSIYLPGLAHSVTREGQSNIFLYSGATESYRVHAFHSQQECEVALTGLKSRTLR